MYCIIIYLSFLNWLEHSVYNQGVVSSGPYHWQACFSWKQYLKFCTGIHAEAIIIQLLEIQFVHSDLDRNEIYV